MFNNTLPFHSSVSISRLKAGTIKFAISKTVRRQELDKTLLFRNGIIKTCEQSPNETASDDQAHSIVV